jgi:hypothetical protein
MAIPDMMTGPAVAQLDETELLTGNPLLLSLPVAINKWVGAHTSGGTV